MKKKLTDKQELFAQKVVEFGNQSEAYRFAYNVSETTKHETINVKASQLMSRDNIRLRVEEIRKSLREANIINKQWIIDKHKEVIDWYLELKELTKKKDMTKEEKSRIYMLKDLIKGSDFRGSLDSVTKILGLNEPEKKEEKIEIEIIEKKRE